MTPEAVERAERLATLPLADMAPPSGLAVGIAASVRDIWGRRHLLNLLTRREIRAKYKDSVLGLLWSLVRPLIMLLIYYFVMGQFLGAARGLNGFAIYVYTGLGLWGLFQEIVSGGTVSVLANSGIVKKIRLPREVFPLAAVGSALFNYLIQFVILVVAVLLTGGFARPASASQLLYLPAAWLIVIVWGTALALVLSAANIYLRDIQYLVEVVLMIGFWVTPVVYSWVRVHDWAAPHGLLGRIFENVYLANPVTTAVMAMQRAMWRFAGEQAYPGDFGLRLGVALVVGLVLLVVAEGVFTRLQRNFAQEL